MDWENNMDQVRIHLYISHVEDQMNKLVVWNERNVDHEKYCRLNLARDKLDPGVEFIAEIGPRGFVSV